MAYWFGKYDYLDFVNQCKALSVAKKSFMMKIHQNLSSKSTMNLSFIQERKPVFIGTAIR